MSWTVEIEALLEDEHTVGVSEEIVKVREVDVYFYFLAGQVRKVTLRRRRKLRKN